MESILQKVEDALDTIRPHLKADGGDIEILKISDDMTLEFRLLGNCNTCSIQNSTIKSIQDIIKSFVPELKNIKQNNNDGKDDIKRV
jgi:Fe-S cluster biogenesis protein NfuA